jgi:hypothetical protein
MTTDYLLPSLSRETTAYYLLYLIRSSLYSGTALQPNICCALGYSICRDNIATDYNICCTPLYLAVLDYNRLSAALHSVLAKLQLTL